MHVAIVVNPGSGRAKTRGSRFDTARRLVDEAKIDAEVVATEARGHGAELARRFVEAGYERVIAWGGDGTVNEVAGPLIGSSATLGIIPGGSGDGYAHSLGLPTRPERALAYAISAAPRNADVGYLAGRHFLNIAGVGFDAVVAAQFNLRKDRGAFAYAVDSLTGVWSYRCREYDVRIGDRRFTGTHFLIAFANGKEYGSGLVIAPDASVFDGELNAILVAGGGILSQFWRARRLAVRPLASARGVWRSRVTSARITGDRLDCHVDGETFETSGEIVVELKPGAIRVAAGRG
jgi:YegS/Rv2252/BmrU family lipid kinase